MSFPNEMLDFIFFPNFEEKIDDLAELAEPENWDYKHIVNPNSKSKPILFNYLRYTYAKLAQENKIELSADGQYLAFNTGLVTTNQEAIFCFCQKQKKKTSKAKTSWFFQGWKRKGEHDMAKFDKIPEMAHYFDDPSVLVFDCKKQLNANIEHIIEDNKDRFPEQYSKMSSHLLHNLLKGAIDSAVERVKRNYKTAIPHYYDGRIQLLLPLCFSEANKAELALVVENMGSMYRAATCLTLDMAYNNARQLVRPDTDWLAP